MTRRTIPRRPRLPAGSEPFTVTNVATFDEPWAMAFLPGAASALVTERAGKLKLWQASGPVLDVAFGCSPWSMADKAALAMWRWH
jgi:glucose/arabinose dehydrogenase